MATPRKNAPRPKSSGRTAASATSVASAPHAAAEPAHPLAEPGVLGVSAFSALQVSKVVPSKVNVEAVNSPRTVADASARGL